MPSSKIDSRTTVDFAQGETRNVVANFGPMISGTTLSGTPTVTQKSGTDTLTLGTPAINTGGAITVDGNSRPVNTCVQFTIETPSDCAAGDYVVTCTVDTAAGDTIKMDCLVKVWA